VVTGLDETARDVLELLARLDQQVVTLGDLDGDSLACVARPDVQAGIARAAVNGQEVEIGVEAGEDGVLLAVLGEIGGCWCEEMRTGIEGLDSFPQAVKWALCLMRVIPVSTSIFECVCR
jgi:hypothetical protein